MAARDEESDLESDWTFVDRATIESIETRQGSVFYSKRTASQSSGGSPCPPRDGAAVTVDSSGGEAEFEVLARFPAHAVPNSNSPLCKERRRVDGSVVAVADDLIDHSSLTADNTDIPSVTSTEGSEASCSLDDGIMIISNHFSPSLEDGNHDTSHSSLQMSSSFCGWQELPQLTESGTYSLTEEPRTSDDEAGIVTISDEVEDQGIEFVHLGQHERAHEDGNMSEQSDSSSFVFDSELFDISEDFEGLNLSESSEVVDTAAEDHAQSVGANGEYKRNGDETYVNNDNGGDDDDSDGEEEKDEESGSVITVDAPTLVLLLCLTTALGFSVGHGLNVYLSSGAAGNSSSLKRPGPDTPSLRYQRFTLKLPEDNVNQEHVWLWKEKEASIALMFDLKELHSKLQKEHFSLLKSYDNMKNRLHVSKVMAWYWRWKFEHDRVVSENSTWTKALEKQVERLEVLYVREKRLADLWRNMKEKEARDTLKLYWRIGPWYESSAQTNSRRPTHKLNLEKNSHNPDDSDGVCSKFPIDFKRRWTQDARVRGTSHALTQHRIAVSNGQEMRVFVWDETRMKSIREDPVKDKSHHNLLVIYQPGSLVKDVILNPNRRVGSVDIPLSLRLIMEDGSVKDFANSKEHESAVVAGEEERVQIVKDKKLNNGDRAKQSAASLHTESESSIHSDTKTPAASADGDERNEIRISRHDQEQLQDRRALSKKGGVRRGVLRGPVKDQASCKDGYSERAVKKGRVVTSKTKERRIRKPCFEKPVKSSRKKGQLEQRKEEHFTLANETTPEVHRKVMKEREVTRKGLENETRRERLVRRKQRRRREDLRRHVRNAGRILQVLYRERRRMRSQKVQLRHERFSVETAKKKLDAEKEQHEQSKDDVKKLIVQLKTEKKRSQKWHAEEVKKLKQSLSMAIKKSERDRRRCEQEKRTELRQIKNKLSKERKKLKKEFKELNSLKKAVRKEYKKWLRELRQVHKEGKKARGRNKPKKGRKNEKQRHRYERYKHKERDRRKIKNKSKKKGELDDIVQENAPSKPERFEKEETKKNLSRGRNKPHQKEKGSRHQYEANKRRERDQDQAKTEAEKEKKCRNDMVASFKLMEKVSSEKSIHAEKGLGRESTWSTNDEQSDLTQNWDYRKQLEQLRQWLLQIEEQKLDQQQLQKDYTKQLRNVQKHCLKQAATEQRSNKPENTAVQPETSKAVAGSTNFSLNFSPSKVQETEEKYTSTERRKKISTEDTDSTEALARLVEIGLYTSPRYTPVPVPNTPRSESIPPKKSCFKSKTRCRKHETSSEVLEHNTLKPRAPDVSPYPAVGGPSGPIPPDKLRKPGSYMDLDQGQRFDDESFSDRWLNHATTEQESCSSRVPNPPPDGGPIPPEGFARVPNPPPDGGPISPEGIRRPYGPWRHGDESWYMRRAKEREMSRKCNSFQTDNQHVRNPSSWMFERANDRAEQRFNREPWYERRAEGRDECRARHGRDAWLLERGYYRKMMNYMSDWHEGWVARGTTKRRGCWGE